MPELTPIEKDAFAEIMNMAVGRAASSLSRLSQSPVSLSVPRVEFLPAARMKEVIGGDEETSLSVVQQPVAGAIAGQAMLVFPETRSLELVRSVLADQDLDLELIPEIARDSLAEIGNIVLNGCLATLADLLDSKIHSDPPTVQTITEVAKLAGEDQDRSLLILHLKFAIEAQDLEGYVCFLLDVDSITRLQEFIADAVSNG